LTETSSETLPVAILENAYQTSDYTYENFERPSVYPTGEIDDAGIDTDGDGRFDYLDVEVEFAFATSGAYEWTVALADSSREEIETVVVLPTSSLDARRSVSASTGKRSARLA
jgi:hypothetical protein